MLRHNLPYQSPHPVLLIGGGPSPAGAIEQACALCPTVVAADGGANSALRAGIVPDLVVGDLDSLSDAARAKIPPDRIHPIAEQDSTDFDKALRTLRAPLVIGVGFLGGRLDHTLAVLNVLTTRTAPPCILVGEDDVVMAVPPREDIALDLEPGLRVSLFPLAPVRGRSTGLRWPIDGLDMAPTGRIGTSNEATRARVTLCFDRPGMVLLLPRHAFDAMLKACYAHWHPRTAPRDAL